MKKFLLRTLSGAVLLLLLCSAFVVGGLYLWLLYLFISIVGLYELCKAVQLNGEKNSLFILLIVATVAYYVLLYFYGSSAKISVCFLTVLALLLMGICVFSYPKISFSDTGKTYFSFIYIPVMLSFVYLTRESDLGIYLVWLIIISSWGCDTFAYLVGCSVGKHKLAKVLSPKKSIEGAIGGSLGAALLGGLYGVLLAHNTAFVGINVEYLALICFLSSMASQIGDLFASAIKREYSIKDYGNLIPGHGGILDRFDSMIVTAPIIYILGVLFR